MKVHSSRTSLEHSHIWCSYVNCQSGSGKWCHWYLSRKKAYLWL